MAEEEEDALEENPLSHGIAPTRLVPPPNCFSCKTVPCLCCCCMLRLHPSPSIAMCILVWDAWAEKKNGRTKQLSSAREDESGNGHIPACENGRVLWEVPAQSAQKPWWWCQACALSLSLSLSLSLLSVLWDSEAPPCADLRVDKRVFVSAAACPISVILVLAFWSILWKKEERLKRLPRE